MIRPINRRARSGAVLTVTSLKGPRGSVWEGAILIRLSELL